MAWGSWRGVVGGHIAVLILLTLAAPTLAQTASPLPGNPPAKPATAAAKSAKPSAPKTAAQKSAAVHAAKKLAQAKANPAAKKLAAAPKKPAATKKIVAMVKKPAPSAKLAATAKRAPSVHVAIAAPRGAVATTATHAPPAVLVSAAAAATKTAVTPVSLVEPGVAVADMRRPHASLPAKQSMTLPPVDVTQPAEVKTPASFVSNFLNEAFRLAKLNGASSLQRRAQLADLFASKMDVKRIAGYTTADRLASLSLDAQQRFRAILVSYLVETYYPQLELAADPSVKVETAAAEPLADGTAVVWTTFTKDGWGSQSVQWRLTTDNGGYKIVDIFSGGASLVQMERDTFQSVMRSGGLPELTAKLDARTKELASAATE
jgi:ABC-type transporter MlaC component